MANYTKFFGIFLALLLTNSAFMSTEARPFREAEPQNYVGEELIMSKIGELYVEAIKTGGPSDGKGHGFTDGEVSQSLQRVMNSGPSPGQGN